MTTASNLNTEREVEGHTLPSSDDLEWSRSILDKIIENISKVIIGKENSIRLLLTAFCARGHVLIEDHPGVGKTMMARAFARTLGLNTKRIQYTPDVVPSDVTGSLVFSRGEDEFRFRPGPVFTNVLLADEVNRGTPRTQSSLLEAMEECAVTVDGVRHVLPDPFFVLATQNPLELHGTFPLPESQLDRFMLRLSLGYPDRESEDRMLRLYCFDTPLSKLESVVDVEGVVRLRNICRKIYLGNETRHYLLELVGELRSDPRVKMGISPRGSLAMARAAQAKALLNGRDCVLPDDIQELAPAVLPHRVVPHSHADDSQALVRDALANTAVPV